MISGTISPTKLFAMNVDYLKINYLHFRYLSLSVECSEHLLVECVQMYVCTYIYGTIFVAGYQLPVSLCQLS